MATFSKDVVVDFYVNTVCRASNQFREMARHYLSRHLMDTDESHQMSVYVPIEPHDSTGLSSLEWPTVVSMFQQPGEGIIWLKEYGRNDYRELDDYSVDELYQIVRNFNSEELQ